MSDLTQAQLLLAYLLRESPDRVNTFARLKEEFPSADKIPFCDTSSLSLYKVLYSGGLADKATLDSRTSGTYHEALDILSKESGAAAALGELIRERDRQNLLLAISRAQVELSQGGVPPTDVAESIREAATSISSTTYAPPWKEYLSVAATEMRSLADRGVELDFGLRELDAKLVLRRNNPIIIAAPTSQGKTALSIRLLARAVKKNLKTCFLCCEDWGSLPYKIASHLYSVPLQYFTRYHVADLTNRRRADEAIELLRQYDNIHIYPEMPLGVFEREVKRIKPDLVVLDYAQRYVECFSNIGKREGVSKLAADFESLIKRYSSYGVLVSQVRRRETAEGGAPRRPRLYDLKESGDLENYASQVLMLWWPWKDRQDSRSLNKGEYIISIEKDKLGECGEIRVIFDGETQTHKERFSNEVVPQK